MGEAKTNMEITFPAKTKQLIICHMYAIRRGPLVGLGEGDLPTIPTMKLWSTAMAWTSERKEWKFREV